MLEDYTPAFIHKTVLEHHQKTWLWSPSSCDRTTVSLFAYLPNRHPRLFVVQSLLRCQCVVGVWQRMRGFKGTSFMAATFIYLTASHSLTGSILKRPLSIWSEGISSRNGNETLLAVGHYRVTMKSLKSKVRHRCSLSTGHDHPTAKPATPSFSLPPSIGTQTLVPNNTL